MAPYKLILAVRNEEAGKKVALDLTRISGAQTDVQVWQLDVLSLDSVKAFVERALRELTRLDVLFNNAGYVQGTAHRIRKLTIRLYRINSGFEEGPYKASADGYERVQVSTLISTLT